MRQPARLDSIKDAAAIDFCLTSRRRPNFYSAEAV